MLFTILDEVQYTMIAILISDPEMLIVLTYQRYIVVKKHEN